MNRQDIALICELPNYKSFLEAAYVLSYSPSVITKCVSNIERELGIPLFIRSNKTRDLSLTPEGEVIIEALRRINIEFNYITNIVEQMRGRGGKEIRIGSQPRFGNQHEQNIVGTFLLENPSINVSLVKASTDVLIPYLLTGKIDAFFVTMHHSLTPDKYFGEYLSRIETMFLASEREMYLGVSERFYSGPDEANFIDFKDFTFAFPFSNSSDAQSISAASTWLQMAKERNFRLKTLFMEGYDNTVFQMATIRPIAITTVSVPEQKRGIRFVRLLDWKGCTNVYFCFLKGCNKKSIQRFAADVRNYHKGLS